MGGIKSDHELLAAPTVVQRQRLGVRRDQERFREDLWGERRLFIAKLLDWGATYRCMEEASHRRASFDDGWVVRLLMAAHICRAIGETERSGIVGHVGKVRWDLLKVKRGYQNSNLF
jgi:hypothetical protein